VRIDSAAWPFVAIAAIPAVILAWMGPPAVALALLVLPIAVALFFRDPDRRPPPDPNLVLAPADGTVMHAGPARPAEAPPGTWQQVSIFLSLLDVHINRTPVAGRVTRVDYHAGRFLPAYRADAYQNEHSEIWIDASGTPVVVRQIVGVLARRVVCRVTAGDEIAPGERIGLMKFGSRMDVFLPPEAVVMIQKGSQVRAGETLIGRLTSGQA
jgi:phosphatidylserine decarboxylase